MAITINVNLDEILQALKDDLTFTGNADKYIKVNATADGFEFSAVSTSVSWGEILGLLSDQTDLQNAFDLKANLSGAAFTGDVSVTTSGSGDTLQLTNSGSGTTLNITNSGSGDFLAIDTNKLVVSNNGNLAVDTNTLFVDATNNRVGIGTATPTTNFHFLETSSTNSFTIPIKFEITRTTGGNGNEITFFGSSTEAGFQIKTGTGFVDFFGNTTNFRIQGTQKITISTNLTVGNSITTKSLALTAATTSSIPLTITAAAGQTANLLEVKNSAGTNLFHITASGGIATNGNAGFTGTGSYTNFTIENGIITAAS